MKAINIQYGPQGEEDVAYEIDKEVITFDDLEFYSHLNIPGGTYARLEFPHNKYGVSVVSGSCTHSGGGTYEVAILYDGSITYNTPLTHDVLGYQDKEDINEILAIISHYTDGQWETDEDDGPDSDHQTMYLFVNTVSFKGHVQGMNQETFNTYEEACKRLKQVYNDTVIEGDLDTIKDAEYSENGARVCYNSMHFFQILS